MFRFTLSENITNEAKTEHRGTHVRTTVKSDSHGYSEINTNQCRIVSDLFQSHDIKHKINSWNPDDTGCVIRTKTELLEKSFLRK